MGSRIMAGRYSHTMDHMALLVGGGDDMFNTFISKHTQNWGKEGKVENPRGSE